MKKRLCAIISVFFICLLIVGCTTESESKEEESSAKSLSKSKEIVIETTTTVEIETTTTYVEPETQASQPANDEEFIESIIESGGATNQAIMPDTNFSQPVHVSETVSGEIGYIISNYTNGSMSAFEKAKAVHDYLVTYVVYDGSDQTRCHTADGALVDHRAVCDGYAKAFMLVMQSLGYPCQLVYGWAGEYHAWNVVCLDGVWYQVDVTWDDPYINGVGYGYGDGSNLSYSYFLLNDATMYSNHSVMWEYNPDGVPACTSTAGMEWVNGILTTSYSPGSTVTSIVDGANSAAWYTSQRYGTFYILLDLNYVGEYTAAFNNFKNSYYEIVKNGYGVSNININAWCESIYLVVKLDVSYW